jgi:endonuclease-3
MPAITNKQQLLTQAQTLLRKKFGPHDPQVEPRPVLEELVYAILREGTTSADADRAYAQLRKAFVDWNEVRVSTVQEVADALRPMSGAGGRAKRVIGLLQKVFEERYTFALDDLDKKGLKQAARQLARYKEDVTDFTVAWVVQRNLGGHAIPLDAPTLRVLTRLAVIEEADPDSLEGVRSSLEHVIPKAKGPEFTELMSVHAKELCVDGTPHCGQCPLKADCPTAQTVLSSAKKPKPKPR